MAFHSFFNLVLNYSFLQGLPETQQGYVSTLLCATVRSALGCEWAWNDKRKMQYLDSLGENFTLGAAALGVMIPTGNTVSCL